MSKIKHYPSVHIETNVYSTTDANVKVQVYEFHSYLNQLIAEFWVPASSLNQIGSTKYVPTEVIKSRCKALGFTFKHNSAWVN